MSTETVTIAKPAPLTPVSLATLQGEWVPASDQPEAIAGAAAQIAERLLAVQPGNQGEREQAVGAVETLGLKLQAEAGHRSKMLKQPIDTLGQDAEDGGQVANALLALNRKMQDLDPNKIDFSMGTLRRALSIIPGVGSAISDYFERWQASSAVLDEIIESLDKGSDQLKRDNITLADDQRAARALAGKLERAVAIGRQVDQVLGDKLATEIPQDDTRYRFIAEELLFPLRQRIIDLQQQLAVQQQAFMTIEVMMRNNKELIRGVQRAKDVTVSALSVAVALALALENQRIVFAKIEALNETTNELIAGTARRLRTQGAEIQKQASSSSLSIDVLKGAFRDIFAALDDIAQFRQSALPNMAQAILEFDQMARTAGERIARLEKGRLAQDTSFGLEIIDAPDNR